MTVVLVSGASSGVGAAIAARFLQSGARVIGLGRNLARLEAVAGLEAVAVDLRDRAALERIAQEPIDILVNNAGMMPPLGPFDRASEADIDTTVAINLTAQIALTRMVLPGMVARQRGHVFFTGSTAGHAAFPNVALYSATKAGIAGFAQGLRMDMAEHGIRVTEIVAGRIESGLYRDILPEETRARMYEGGLAVQPEDVAEMVHAVQALPPHVDVARFDILPTRQTVATGSRT